MHLDSVNIPGEPVKVKGSKGIHEIFMFSISTCQWCTKGKKWLEEKSLTYSYLDIDKISIDDKRKLKRELKEAFNTIPRFPMIIVDRCNHSTGFSPNEWEELLGA